MMMMSWTNTSSFVGGNVFMRADLPHTCLNPTFSSAVLEFIVLVSIPEAFRGPAPSYPIWPFKSSFPTKITPVLWPVTCGCVVWSAEAQGLPPLSVVPICGTELPLCSHSKHSSRTTAFLSACELKLFLSNELLLRLFFFLILLNFIFTSARVNAWFSVDFGFFCPCVTALCSAHALLIVLDLTGKTSFFRSAMETKVWQW